MRPCPVERVEPAPHYVLGAAVIRGQTVPVLDTGVLLTGEPCVASRFVVMRVGERRVALAVTEVFGARSIGAAELGGLPPLFAGSGDLLRGLGVLDGQLLEVLESSRLVELASEAEVRAP